MNITRIITNTAGITICFLIPSCNDPAVRQGAKFANVGLQGSGSPFRAQPTADGRAVEYHLVSTPVILSEAVGQLRHDILVDIGRNEIKHGGQASPKLIETRSFTRSAQGIREIWLVDRNGQTIAYVITMMPSPQGGTDFRLQGGVPVIP
jgi:hypothetical protein